MAPKKVTRGEKTERKEMKKELITKSESGMRLSDQMKEG
jgi:hypothetical protein